MENNTQDTLELLKGALKKTASVTVSTGLVNYDLSPAAKTLYPVITPLRNTLPRVMGNGDTATRWKQILSPDTSGSPAYVSEGNRGSNVTFTSTDVTAAYAGLGREASVSFEADFASQGFDDARALAVKNALFQLMIQEEQEILFGNASMALGVTPTPVATLLTAQGSLTAQATVVKCVALTPFGMLNATVANGLKATIAKTNVDGTTDTIPGGTAQVSANSNSVTTTGSNLAVSAHVAPVVGAAGYAWFIGLSGATKLAAITSINSVIISADPAGGAQSGETLFTSDHSSTGSSFGFDGFITQALKNGAGYFSAFATGTDGTGTPMTSDGSGGINEINTALQAFWDKSSLSPSRILVNSQEANSIKKLALANGSAPIVRFMSDNGGKPFIGGNAVASYYNQFAYGQEAILPIQIHPNMPKGMILFVSDQLPYPVANIPGVAQIKTRRDYYQIDWPLKTRAYEFGVYTDQVLQVFAPFSLGVIANIQKS